MRNSDLVDSLRLAHEALILVTQGKSERSAISQIVSQESRLRREKSSALRLVIGVVSTLDLLNHTVRLQFPTVKLDRRSLSLFRLAAHLLLVDQTNSKADLVNALRRISPQNARSQLEQLMGSLLAMGVPDPPEFTNEYEREGFRTHNPSWWVSYCFYHFGRDAGLRILNSLARPRYVRVNTLRTRGRVVPPADFKTDSAKLEKIEGGVYRLTGSPSALSRYFVTGIFQLQDYASYLAVKAGDPSPGDKVLDLCAAPGGKTATLAQLMKNRGEIVSVDYSRERMSDWSREVDRLGVKIASPLIGDASNLGLKVEFDLVLLDPPCTGTGILDRNPRMKWHLSPRLVQKFAQLQSKMLDESSKYVTEDGRILYCTCSLTLEENEYVVSRFLTNHPEFETSPVLTNHGSPGVHGQNDCRRLYPYKDATAGYFVARLDRVL